MKDDSDSDNALLLWYFVLATVVENRDSKLRKPSLLPVFVNKKFWKSLYALQTTVKASFLYRQLHILSTPLADDISAKGISLNRSLARPYKWECYMILRRPLGTYCCLNQATSYGKLTNFWPRKHNLPSSRVHQSKAQTVCPKKIGVALVNQWVMP